MPKQYEAIRNRYIAAGKSESLAKKLAAMTYNAHRKPGQAPVTGRHEGALERVMKKHGKK